MLDLIERKWLYFAGDAYRTRFLTFAAMLLSVFAVTASDPDTPLFYAASVSTLLTWPLFLRDQIRQLRAKLNDENRRSGETSLSSLQLTDLVDAYNVVLVPILLGFCIYENFAGELATLTGNGVAEALATLAGILEVTLIFSMLRLVAQFRVLGPLLITVYQMVNDALRFAVVIAIVVFGYANGFYALVHFGSTEAQLASLDFDYSYASIVTNMCLWLTGQPELSLIEPLSPGVQLGASLLFWSFIATAYFILLNLLIAIFNTTYERVLTNSVAEWLFVRLRTTLEFEAAPDQPGVQAYFDQLQARDNQRAVKGQGVDLLDGGTDSFLPEWARGAKAKR